MKKGMAENASRPSREEMMAQMAQSAEGRKMLQKIQGLRSSMDSLRKQQAENSVRKAGKRQQGQKTPQPAGQAGASVGAPNINPAGAAQTGARGGADVSADEQRIRAAEQAVLKGVQEDAQTRRRLEKETRWRQIQMQAEQQKALEAQKRAARISEEAEQKRQKALEAERKAKEVAHKTALEALEAERRAIEEARLRRQAEAARRKTGVAETAKPVSGNAVQRKASAAAQTLQEQKLRLQIQQLKIEKEKARAEAAIRSRSEKARRRAEERQRHKEEVRRQRLEKVTRKRAEKTQKLEARERRKQEKRRLAEVKARLEAQSKADAEMGGGIVNVQGVQIKTEVNKQPTYSLRDLFGIRSKAEKRAATKEEQARMAEERQARQTQAQEAAHIRSIQRRAAYEKSKIGQKIARLKSYSEAHKRGMLMVFAIVMMSIMGAAGVLNYCTAYEYSYNGQKLGLVKEKDDVLQITDLVQSALTEEKNMKIVIDAKDDITFHRKLALDETQIDDSEQVLKRLTYMGDLKIKATGIYVDGRKIGAVQDRKTAENVLKDVADKYTKEGDNIEIESVRFLEKVDVKTANTDLSDLHSEEEMVDLLCTSGEKETLHKIVAGDTLHSIARQYDVEEDQLLADNKGINEKKLDVGRTIVVRQQAPVLTYEVVEKMTYDKTIEHEVEEQKSDDIYEGITETKQAGSDGVSEITARVTLQNGKKVKEDNLSTTVKSEPVTEVVLVGTKERPPTVGSGKYIWPLKDGFTRSSGFGARWGRLHKGIDLAVSVGTTVYAADGGTVTEAQYSGSYGNVVVIDHQNGQETRYAHNSKLLVKKGDKVYQGQAIAKSGNTGRSTGPHLHFEIRINGEPRNPLNYLP